MYIQNRYIRISVLLAVVLTIFYFAVSEANISSIKTIGFFSIFLLIFTLYSWRKCGNNLLCGYTVFICAFYAFNVGQVILEAVNANPSSRSLIIKEGLSYSTFFDCAYYSLMCLIAFHIGSLIEDRRVSVNFPTNNTTYDIADKMFSIEKIGLVLLCVSIPCFLINLYLKIDAVLMYGYMALYDSTINTGSHLYEMIGDFYVPSLLSILFVSEWQKKKRWFWRIVVLATVIIPPFILGGRTQAMIMIALFMLIYGLFNTIKRKHVIMGVIVLYFVLFAFNIIALTRTSTGITRTDYAEIIADSENNPALETLAEMGGSMHPLALTMNVVPSTENFRYGKSILYAFFTIVPNLGFWEYHPAKKESNLGEWLMRKYNLSYGPGFSLIAEGYINFGFLGPLALLILGIYYLRIIKYADKKYLYVNPFMVVFSLVFLWFSIKGVRNSFIGAVRAFVYYAGPMYLMIKYYYNRHYCNHR